MVVIIANEFDPHVDAVILYFQEIGFNKRRSPIPHLNHFIIVRIIIGKVGQ
jgi:hypothetical protein